MDIIHHAAIGGIAMATLATTGNEIAGGAFLIGSVLPDLDVFFMILGKRAYLKNHQGLSHSLCLAPVIAYLISLPFFSITKDQTLVFSMALLGGLTHIFLDWNNTFGIRLFWPLRKTRFCNDALFFVDLFLWCLTLIFAGLIYFYQDLLIGTIYFILFFAYVAFKVFFHQRVCLDLNCCYAIPSSLNPFTFYILEQTSSGVNIYMYNGLYKIKWNVKFCPWSLEKYVKLASSSQLYCDMQQITKFLFITKVSDNKNGISIIANDLAVRNYGGKFGRTVLSFNPTGKLLEEKASI